MDIKNVESIVTKSIISALLAVIVFISGIWLRKTGEPYKTGIFAVHKLTVVAMVVFLVLIYIDHFKTFNFQGFGFFLFILSSILFIIAFISGALLSVEKTARFFFKIIHKVSSILTVIMIPVIWLYCH